MATPFEKMGLTYNQVDYLRNKHVPAMTMNQTLEWIKGENSFKPTGDSVENTPWGHAQGLVQLIPPTSKKYGVKDPYNAYQNLEGGFMHMADGYAKFGNLGDTFSSYFGGFGGKKHGAQKNAWRPNVQAYGQRILNAGGIDIGNAGVTAGTGAIAQEQLQRPSGNIDMIRAYNQGLQQQQQQKQQQQQIDTNLDFNFMQPFEKLRMDGPSFQDAFKRYSDFRG